MIATFLPIFPHLLSKTIADAKYSAQSNVPGYSLLLRDTGYFDYLTAKAKAFDPLAIVDSSVYRKDSGSPARHTVKAIRFVLSDTIPEMPVSVIVGSGTMEPGGIISQAGYTVDSDTMVVSVWLNIKSLTSSTWMTKYELEDVFLRATINAIYYSRGLTTVSSEHNTLINGRVDLQQNIYSGLFSWPIQISIKK